GDLRGDLAIGPQAVLFAVVQIRPHFADDLSVDAGRRGKREGHHQHETQRNYESLHFFFLSPSRLCSKRLRSERGALPGKEHPSFLLCRSASPRLPPDPPAM